MVAATREMRVSRFHDDRSPKDKGSMKCRWALGVLMFEMMAGRSPFELGDMQGDGDLNTEDRLFQVWLGAWPNILTRDLCTTIHYRSSSRFAFVFLAR